MSDVVEFREFPKIARLSRDIIITEKIDGTNAQVFITEDGEVFAGSRSKYITPFDDNHGFAQWVKDNITELLKLGAGRHFGEWWGSGINRGYGLKKGEKHFSLFNVGRWCLQDQEPKVRSINPETGDIKYQDKLPSCCSLVPILYEGKFDTELIDLTLRSLEASGSITAPGFMNPEGIVIFHTAANVFFKKTIKNDEMSKTLIKNK